MFAIDLFAGIGGLGLGFKNAGFEVTGVEIDYKKAKVYALNVGTAIRADVRAFAFKRKLATVIIAGPPCRPYSRATPKFRRGAAHPEYGLDMEVARATAEAEPEVVVVEEVPGWRPNQLLGALNELGYSAEVRLINFGEFGVPIAKKRWILIALKSLNAKDIFKELEKMREKPLNPEDVLNLPETLGAFPDHRTYNIKSIVKELVPYIPPGYSLLSAYKAGLLPEQLIRSAVKDVNKKHSYWLYRVPLKGPVKMVPHPRRSLLLHPLYDRPMSVRELARLMTFPDSFSFAPLNADEAMRAIGESIPPKFSEKLAKVIRNNINQILGGIVG